MSSVINPLASQDVLRSARALWDLLPMESGHMLYYMGYGHMSLYYMGYGHRQHLALPWLMESGGRGLGQLVLRSLAIRTGRTHGSCLIRRQRGHPGVVLSLVVSSSANHQEGMHLELSPIRSEPNWK